MRHRHWIAVAVVLLLGADGSALVGQDGSSGFVVRHETNIDASPARVYAALVGEVGSWWDSAHTFSGDSNNLFVEARPGGCLCERLPDGGGVEHLRVIYVAPERQLRLSGGLGPLQASAVTGTLTWTLADADGRTTLGLSYSVGGFMEGGLDRIAPAVEAVLADQLGRLKSYVETGDPVRGS